MKNWNRTGKIVLLFISLFFLNKVEVVAQDTIIKISGVTIIGKVVEITFEDIKYKKLDLNNSETISINKSDVKTIRFANGLKETFKPLKAVKLKQPEPIYSFEYNKLYYYDGDYIYHSSPILEREFKKVLKNTGDEKIMQLLEKQDDANERKYIAFASIPAGIAALVSFVGAQLKSADNWGHNSSTPYVPTASEKQAQNELYGLSLFCVNATISFQIISAMSRNRSDNCEMEAIKLYNEKY